MRYVWKGGILYQQWLDKRVVTMQSTYHKSHESVIIERHGKFNGQHVHVLLFQSAYLIITITWVVPTPLTTAYQHTILPGVHLSAGKVSFSIFWKLLQ